MAVEQLIDSLVGTRLWFEYHCFESSASCDAELWYRSHQQVDVIEISGEGGGDNIEERLNNGHPRTYKIRFDDGYIDDAFEDELLVSSNEFVRPDPPKI